MIRIRNSPGYTGSVNDQSGESSNRNIYVASPEQIVNLSVPEVDSGGWNWLLIGRWLSAQFCELSNGINKALSFASSPVTN